MCSTSTITYLISVMQLVQRFTTKLNSHLSQISKYFLSLSLQMYKQSKGTPEKPKPVQYFNQFPENFLRPYGRVANPPDEETISKRINPISCEWFGRPKVAMSEFADTITQNMELLKDEDMKYELIDTAKFSEISQEIHPFLDALDRLSPRKSCKDKKDKAPPTGNVLSLQSESTS